MKKRKIRIRRESSESTVPRRHKAAGKIECPKAQLVELIEQLSENSQKTMQLYYLEERSCQEIALLLRKPLGTIKSQVSRGRRKLQQLLDGRVTRGKKYETWRISNQTLIRTAHIEKLPRSYRIIMQLHYIEKQSYREMAQLLGKPVNTVKSLVHRGREMLSG